jgi:hypothetical protein
MNCWWYYPWYRRRRGPFDDWVESLSTPQKAALLLTVVVSLPFLMIGTVLAIYQLIILAFNPTFWFLILAFILWGACQKKK